MTVVIAALALPAYLLGTFPSAELVARRAGHDVSAEGSGNPGASNVFRILGWRAGLLVFALDLGKGLLPALAGLLLDGRGGAFALGIAAVVGHVFPATRRFKGGRGVATAAGVMLVVYPLIALCLAAVWLIVAYGFRKASVASLLITVAFPVLVALRGYGWAEVAVTGVLAVLIVVRHASNLRRLARGEEGDLRPDPEEKT
ncbi:MAG: glycerol-3-phosphate 1-O-acyltransferase PlsY [Acidimicrobiia bacterium]